MGDRQKQVDLFESETAMVYLVSSRTTVAALSDTVSKIKEKENNNNKIQRISEMKIDCFEKINTDKPLAQLMKKIEDSK